MKLDVYLNIRHGLNLILRNIEWKITEQLIPTFLKGRRVLESLGCDNQKTVLAARDRYGSDVDIKARLMDGGNAEESSGEIAALCGKSVFHKGGALENDGMEEDNSCADFCDDTAAEACKELDQRVDEAAKNEPSENGVKELKKAIEKHNEIFKSRQESGGPASVAPMKIALNPTKKPVQVKIKRYPANQGNFLDKHITQLSNMGFIKPYT